MRIAGINKSGNFMIEPRTHLLNELGVLQSVHSTLVQCSYGCIDIEYLGSKEP